MSSLVSSSICTGFVVAVDVPAVVFLAVSVAGFLLVLSTESMLTFFYVFKKINIF